MKLNNIEKYFDLMEFKSPFDFYYIEIKQRGKDVDNPLKSGDRLIKTFEVYQRHVETPEARQRLTNELTEYADLFKARVYGKLTASNAVEVLNLTIAKMQDKQKVLLEKFANGKELHKNDYKNVSRLENVLMSTRASSHTHPPKWSFIDLDSKDSAFVERVEAYVKMQGREIVHRFETLNGEHLITERLDTHHYPLSKFFTPEECKELVSVKKVGGGSNTLNYTLVYKG